VTAALLRGRRTSNGPCLSRYPLEQRSLSRLLIDQAARLPERAWVVFDDSRDALGDSHDILTYGAALARARQVATRLASSPRRGATPRVGLMMRNCPEYLVALHGTLLAGGLAILIDPDLPPAPLAALLERAALDWLLVDADSSEAARRASQAPTQRVEIGADWNAWISAATPAALPPLPRHDADALVMFTSGTTGQPKGVVMSHHYAFLYGAVATDSLSRTEDDVISGPLPLFHTSGLQMIVHSALHAGGTAHLRRRFSASRYWEEIAADGATQGCLVAEMGRMIQRRSADAPPHRLRNLSIGGLLDHEEFERRFRVRVLWQGYGMTEAYPCPMGPAPWGGIEHTIGMPMDYVEYGVVDADDRLLPQGETGELVLRMPPHFMFERYLDDEAATQQAMRGGLFHTGDRMSISPEGLLAHRGRAGERLRHHGENVDPRAIELAALAQPGVREAAAFGVPGALGDDDVKLDVVADAGLDLAALRAALAAHLPKKSLPRYLECRDELPRSGTFKIRKHRLREDGVNRPGVFDAEAPAVP